MRKSILHVLVIFSKASYCYELQGRRWPPPRSLGYTSDLQQGGGSNIVKMKSKTVFFYSLQRNSRA